MNTSTNATPISIIVPVFNTERFLMRCLESLFNQTIARSIQFVFINDASTDSSLSILENAAASHPELDILLLNNETNKGLAYTRSRGIKEASGEYVMQCDSDDWIEPEMAETLLNAAMQCNADIVTSPFFLNTKGQQLSVRFKNTKTIGDINAIPNDVLHFSVCNKLIRRSLITDNSLYSIKGTDCWEDLAITCRALALSKKTICVDTPLYHYRKEDNNSSLTSQKHKVILADHLFYAEFLDKWFHEKGNEFYQHHTEFLNRLKFTAKIKMLRGDTIEITRWKNTFPECNSHIFKNAKQYNLTTRIGFKALALLPTSVSIALLNAIGKHAE